MVDAYTMTTPSRRGEHVQMPEAQKDTPMPSPIPSAQTQRAKEKRKRRRGKLGRRASLSTSSKSVPSKEPAELPSSKEPISSQNKDSQQGLLPESERETNSDQGHPYHEPIGHSESATPFRPGIYEEPQQAAVDCPDLDVLACSLCPISWLARPPARSLPLEFKLCASCAAAQALVGLHQTYYNPLTEQMPWVGEGTAPPFSPLPSYQSQAPTSSYFPTSLSPLDDIQCTPTLHGSALLQMSENASKAWHSPWLDQSEGMYPLPPVCAFPDVWDGEDMGPLHNTTNTNVLSEGNFHETISRVPLSTGIRQKSAGLPNLLQTESGE